MLKVVNFRVFSGYFQSVFKEFHIRSFENGPHPQYGWEFPEEIPERPRKRSQSVSWNFPREYGWDAPNPIIQGIWGIQSVSRILSPPVRLGTPLFSELVPERASQSWSWNSQQYWGYFWEKGLADTGGWREEILERPEIHSSVPFFLCPLRRRGTHFWRVFWGLFWGVCLRQPPPANPFSKPPIIGDENWKQTFFLKLFGHPRDIRAKIPGYHGKKFGFPGFPHPFTWKTPTHPKLSGPKSLGLGSFFLPWFQGIFRVISGYFQGVFSYALSGYDLWTLPNINPRPVKVVFHLSLLFGISLLFSFCDFPCSLGAFLLICQGFAIAKGEKQGNPKKQGKGEQWWGKTTNKKRLIVPRKKTSQPETWQDSAFFSPPGNRAMFSAFWGDFLIKLHRKPGEIEQIHWRKFKKSKEEPPPGPQHFKLTIAVKIVTSWNSKRLIPVIVIVIGCNGLESLSTPGCHNGPKFLETCFEVLETLFSKRYFKYALASRKYALTPRKYAPTSRKDFERILLRDFWTIFGFKWLTPLTGGLQWY